MSWQRKNENSWVIFWDIAGSVFENIHDFKNLADIFTFQTLKHLANLNSNVYYILANELSTFANEPHEGKFSDINFSEKENYYRENFYI